VIGEGDAIPDVEAAIRTLAPGQTGDFTVLFPPDFPDPACRGDQERLRIHGGGPPHLLREQSEIHDEK